MQSRFLTVLEGREEMKRAMRRIRFFSLLVAATLFVQNAAATITTILPDSSHHQGRAYYGTRCIEFAVYDTVTNPDEFIGADGFTAPGTGRYIYAYQIFTNDASTFPAEYFAIGGIGENALAEPVNDNIGWESDSPGDPGVEPDRAYITSSSMLGTMGAWEFDDSPLVAGEHSYFLVLRSNMDWTWGTYTFNKTLAGEPPIPGSPSIPEPGTLALLGIGSLLTLLRRKRYV